MATTSVTVRMDKDVRKRVEILFNEMGLNMTTAVTIFARAVVRQGRITFEIAADPISAEANLRRVRQSAKEADEGKVSRRDLLDE